MTSLAPRSKGGVERDIRPTKVSQDGDEAMNDDDDAEASAGPSAIPKGMGRIVRDAEGNVVDIIMGGEESEDEDAPKDKGKARAEDTPLVTGEFHSSPLPSPLPLFLFFPADTLVCSSFPTSSRVDRRPNGQATPHGNGARTPLPPHAPVKARQRHGRDGEGHSSQQTAEDQGSD